MYNENENCQKKIPFESQSQLVRGALNNRVTCMVGHKRVLNVTSAQYQINVSFGEKKVVSDFPYAWTGIFYLHYTLL